MRIAIIDHASHTLYVEDINDEILEEQYSGQEQKYIEDNYTFGGKYSWDCICDAAYFPDGESDPIEIDFNNLID